ncbi:DNA damage-regulated autophagy modulator protein 2-like [Ostrea edulis]|uniref:DNA damage-regulated autophagy modulator protein 2-like n=1 Tax=Ostrea edulis TaxID=37623 RepID=UPI0024AEF8D5|nr:DNA damage-regulated autophagy modulator protein 2-like [Ostrea edulis]
MEGDRKRHSSRVAPYSQRSESKGNTMDCLDIGPRPPDCLDITTGTRPPGCLDCLRTRLHLLPIITFTWLGITVCLSYTLAAIKNDTEADFPYISKTANDDPQRAIFAQMVTIGSVLYGMCSTMRYLSIKADLLSCSVSRGYHRLNIACLCVGLLVCLGNSLLGNFPTDGYNSYFKGPHYVGAAMAFIGGVVYGWIQTRLSWVLDRKQRWTGRVQLLLIIWTTVALLTFGISKTVYELQKSKGYGTKENELRDVYLASTITEWILAFSIAGFPLTFIRDFKASILRSPKISRRDYTEQVEYGIDYGRIKEDKGVH